MPKKRVYRMLSDTLSQWLHQRMRLVTEANGRIVASAVEVTKRAFSFSGVYERLTPVRCAPIDFVYLIDRKTLESKVKLQNITTGDYYYYGAKGLNFAAAIQSCLDAIALVKIKEETNEHLNDSSEPNI
jgi:hypothetical protein